MHPSESVAEWLGRLKVGDRAAVEPLWNRFFSRLVALARGRLPKARAVRDEEDLALSAFASFCRGAERGRFPRLDDQDDLWRVLLTILQRKVCDQIERDGRLKRGAATAPVGFDLDLLADGEPTPALAALMADQCEQLLRRLNDETLRQIALWKMEGFTVEEMARKLGVVPRTVERKLRVIRELWEDAGEVVS